VDTQAFWRETSITEEDFVKWMQQQREKISGYTHALKSAECGSVLEVTVEMKDGKRHLHRMRLEATPDADKILSLIA
jgi:hypothetical protein